MNFKMSDDPKSQGNILVNPSNVAARLASIEIDLQRAELEQIEKHLGYRLRLGGAITYMDENGEHVIEDREGIRPFPEGSDFPSPPESA